MAKLSELVMWAGTNPWISILSLIIAIIGIFLAILFYLKSRKLRVPCFAKRSINIIRQLVSTIESLEMLYAGKPIENLTVTKVAFWNAGKETIHSNDIASADPLVVKIKNDHEMLNAKVTYSKNPANQFSISDIKNQKQFTLQFDYLDKDEGAIIQILHTGISGEDIDVTGTVKGVGKLHRKPVLTIKDFPIPFPKGSKRSIRHKRRFVGFTLFIIPLILGSILFLLPSKTTTKEGLSITGKLFAFGFTGFLYWGLAYFILKRRIPKGFETLEEDFI